MAASRSTCFASVSSQDIKNYLLIKTWTENTKEFTMLTTTIFLEKSNVIIELNKFAWTSMILLSLSNK